MIYYADNLVIFIVVFYFFCIFSLSLCNNLPMYTIVELMNQFIYLYFYSTNLVIFLFFLAL